MAVSTSVRSTTQTLVQGLAMHDPFYIKTLLKDFPNEFENFSAFWSMMGRDRALSNQSTRHFEKGRTWLNLGSASNTGAPGAGNPLVWTLPAAEHNDAGTTSYARVGDVILFGGVYGRITVVNTTTPSAFIITAQPFNTTDAFPAITTASRVMIWGDAYAEGSSTPPGRTPSTTEYIFYTQNILDSFTMTGTEKTNSIWTSEDGNGNYGYYGATDTEDRMKNALNMACLIGPGTPGSPSAAMTNINIATGVLPWAETGGNVQTYTPTNWQISDIKATLAQLDSIQADKDYMWNMSYNQYDEVQTAFQNAYGAGAIRYADYNGMKDISLALNIKALDVNYYNLMLKRLQTFSNPTMLGTPGAKYLNYGVGIPMGKTVDGFSGKQVPIFETVYKSMNGYSRKFRIWETGGAASTPTDNTDTVTINYLTEAGCHPKRANAFFVQTQ